MGRLIRYGALGAVLVAGAAGLWAWRGAGPVATHPDLAQPTPVAAVPTASLVPPATSPTTSASAPPGPTAIPVPAMPPGSMAQAGPSAVAALPASGATATASLPMEKKPAASFDVVRIGPQGNAVIAGRASPNTDVVALDGETVIGRATADKQGEWVILPAAALPPGSHTLRLDVPMPGGQPSAGPSDEVSITVPAPSGPAVAALPVMVSPASTPNPMLAGSVAGATAALPRAASAADLPITKPQADASTAPAGQPGMSNKPVAEKVVTAAIAAARDKSLTVKPGNSLWRIARQSYGDGGRYAVIYSANRNLIGDPDLIYPGQVFTLPTN